VIGPQKLIALEAIEVVHLLKHSADFASSIRLESDVRNCARFGNGFVIVERTVTLVSAHFAQLEILGSLIDQRGQLSRRLPKFSTPCPRAREQARLPSLRPVSSLRRKEYESHYERR